MDINKIEHIYFIGIGGIGMSALARYFKIKGKKVAGYDKTPSPLTDQLEKENIHIHFEDNVASIPDNFTSKYEKEKTLIIYTPAIPAEHKELTYFNDHSFLVKKRAEVLGILAKDKKCIAIGGSHGKTSVTSILTHILKTAGLNIVAFVGGITKNYNSNLIMAQEQGKELLIIEADEYDRSFLQLKPDIAVITAIDPDHLDVYSNISSLRNAFGQFIGNIKPNGALICKKGIDELYSLNNLKTITYALDEKSSDMYAKNIKSGNGAYVFDMITPKRKLTQMNFGLPGPVNIENALAATSVALHLGVEEKSIRNALENFKGVKRRFDFLIKTDKIVYMDDYAHHPEEIKSCINSVKDIYPDRKITGIFQPHLYSRTRDLSKEFAKSLEALDELILLDIYPAREKPIKGVTSDIIFEKVNIENKLRTSKDELIDVLKNKKPDVLLTIGAGDIDRLVKPIKKLFEIN
jgi:UDP-N-acetylmuramate--alanine ligase